MRTMENRDWQPLRAFPCREFPIFLKAAIAMTAALAKFHKTGPAHLNLSPDTFFLSTGQTDNGSPSQIEAIIGGFEKTRLHPLSVDRPPEHQPPDSPAYSAPELNGRMATGPDPRADLYSLGILFYEMLTGTVPFSPESTIEVAHAHLTLIPPEPHNLRAEISPMLSAIVMRLLAKNPEDRYQTATGLLHDLHQCQRSLESEGRIRPFIPGERDTIKDLSFPAGLYGRSDEAALLTETFLRSLSGPPELLVVSGRAGVGKTRLVNEILGPVAEGGFLSGKCDQHRQDLPYGVVSQAFRGLARRLLARDAGDQSSLKADLNRAVFPNGRLLTEVLPELEEFMGDQPPVGDAGPAEARNRFNYTFRRFLSVIVSSSSPLLLFLDDLHWADSASLALVQGLLWDASFRGLLVIGAYRDNEVDENHPLISFVREIEEQNGRITRLALRSLDEDRIHDFIADTLSRSKEDVVLLARTVHRKTQGNPFFARELLKEISREGILFHHRGRWEWQTEALERHSSPATLVGALREGIGRWTEPEQRAIRVAACVGMRFSTELLATILKQQEEKSEIEDLLATAGRLNYIMKDGNDWCFVHDRIREAAASLLSRQDWMDVHRRIGIVLRDQFRADPFAVLEHLNQAREIITDYDERIELARLNQMAGSIARRQAAFGSTLTYLRIAEALLPADRWTGCYDLAAIVAKDLVEAEYLNGNHDESERLALDLLPRLRSDTEKARIYSLLCLKHSSTNRFAESLATGRKALALLGIDFPEGDFKHHQKIEMERFENRISGRLLNDLLAETKNADETIRIAIDTLDNMGNSAYFSGLDLLLFYVAHNLNMMLDGGSVADQLLGLSNYSGSLSIMGERKKAFEIWLVVNELIQKADSPRAVASACLRCGNFTVPWFRPLRESEAINRLGLRAALVSGSFPNAGYFHVHLPVNAFHYGRSLKSLMQDIPEGHTFLKQTKNQLGIDILEGLRYILDRLVARPGVSSPDLRAGRELLNDFIANDRHVAAGQFAAFLAQLLFHAGAPAGALECITTALPVYPRIAGIFSSAEFYFYHSLALLALLRDCPDSTGLKSCANPHETIETNQRQMKSWAEDCPHNFEHRFLLVEAERARLERRDLEAADHYERAIVLAREEQYLQNEALACRLAGDFWLARDNVTVGRTYLRHAHESYEKWGAQYICDRLEQMHPWLREGSFSVNPRNQGTAIAGALQAISSEIVLDPLLRRLVRIILDTMGATRILLIFERSGELFLEAEGAVQGKGEIHSRSLSSRVGADDALLPVSLVRHCAQTGEDVILNRADTAGLFTGDPYIRERSPKSILCTAGAFGDTKLISYVENAVTYDLFTPEGVEMFKLLSLQAAISLEHARLFREKQDAVHRLEALGKVRDSLLRRYEGERFKNLQERMNPHFLFNAIHTVHALLQTDPTKADRALLLLAEIFHFLTDRSFESLIPFAEVWQFASRYVEFQKIRFPEILSVLMQKDEQLDGLKVPPLILQPLIENAIKHGLRKRAGGGTVAVEARLDDGLFRLEVRDDGAGLQSDNLYSRTIGNIRDRLRYHFEGAQVTVENQSSGGVCVRISLRMPAAPASTAPPAASLRQKENEKGSEKEYHE